MHAMINIALRAARTAAEALLQSSDRLDRIQVINNDPSNFVSSIDKEAESTLVYHLQKAYPDHSIQTRLGENIEGSSDEPTWFVDPLIGSFNYSRGIDCYGIAMACQIEGIVTHSVLVLPARSEEFWASRGTGAQLNGRRIRVNDKNIDQPIFAFDAEAENTGLMTEFMQEIVSKEASIRMSGCIAADMAYTAAGRFTGGWSMNIGSASQLAAGLILTEAGALLGSDKGSPDLASASELVFAGPKAFKTLVIMRQLIGSD